MYNDDMAPSTLFYACQHFDSREGLTVARCGCKLDESLSWYTVDNVGYGVGHGVGQGVGHGVGQHVCMFGKAGYCIVERLWVRCMHV